MPLSAPVSEVAVDGARASIVLVGNDGLAYLIARYAERSGVAVHPAPVGIGPDEIAALRPRAVWVASLESLERFRPRETGLLDEDCPVIVSSSESDDRRARELGADYCAMQPLTYADFLLALDAVGVAVPMDAEGALDHATVGGGPSRPIPD
jgi:hypothetical protein